ncbi:MAG: hypothetical protein LUE99_13340 [Bacteroides sp.]|nr:hypothetical protein [Bacteroides sp.]
MKQVYIFPKDKDYAATSIKTYLIAILGSFFIGFVLPTPAHASRQQKKDSLRLVISKADGAERIAAYQQLVRLYQLEVQKDQVLDTILNIYDILDAEAGKAGNLADQGLIRTNRLAAISDKQLHDEVIRQAPPSSIFLQRTNSGIITTNQARY